MRIFTVTAAFGCALFSAAALAAAGQGKGESRTTIPESRSVAGFEQARAGPGRRDPALLEAPEAPGPARSGSKDRPTAARKHTVVCCAFRIFDARVQLYDDFDLDGYYTYFRVSFDVDTDYADADVYARLFLRGPTGIWNLFYETDVFSIHGSSGTDDYEVETELLAGYPTGDYDLLIEVYDADYGDLVIEYGPWDTSALGYVPLEDTSHDGLLPPPVAVSHGGGGGAVAVEILGLLGIALWLARRRQGAAGRPVGEAPLHQSHGRRRHP